MKTYQYTSPENTVVSIIDDDGISRMSMLASALPLGTEVLAYVAPPAPVPQVLTMRQARLVLHQVGLLDDVEVAVAAADRAVQIEWEYAQEVHRNWPTLVTLAGALQLDDAALDALFMAGSHL